MAQHPSRNYFDNGFKQFKLKKILCHHFLAIMELC